MRMVAMVFGGMTILCLSIPCSVAAQSSFTDDVVIDIPDSELNLMPLINTVTEAQFVNMSGSNENVRARLLQQYRSRLQKIDEQCLLTDEQRQKLQLAARGDIARLMSKVDHLREKYVNQPIPAGGMIVVSEEIVRDLMVPLTLPFGEKSLFAKVLHHQLTEAQSEQYQALDLFERRDAVRNMVAPFFRGLQPLSLVQERLIVERIVSRYPAWHPHAVPMLYAHYIAILVADDMSDELRPILDDTQWQHLQSQIPAGRRLEPRLRSFGLWPIREEPIRGRQ